MRGRPKKAKVYSGDAALDKILAARQKVQPIAELEDASAKEAREHLLNIRRGLKGALVNVEKFLGFYHPKCAKCYELYGFLNKCVCNVK